MKLISNVLSISFLFLMITTAFGQSSFREKSDPEATKILKNLKKIYGKYEGIEIEYNLELEYGEDKEVQTGKILQEGDKYRINNNGNIIINDGNTVWMYIQKQNEVQINDFIADEEEAPFTPAKIFNMDENDDEFVYVITGEDSRGYKIEFKPRDPDSEIMKIRIRVDKAQTKINSVKVFSDDGSRMTFVVNKIKNTKPSSSSFRFNKEKHPGVKVIDLRD